MNIDDLVKIAGLLGAGETKQATGSLDEMVGKKAIIRTYSAGVWFGKIDKKSGKEVILTDARRINYFKTIKGISLSSIANHGVHSDSRIAEPVQSIWLEAIELIPCNNNSIKSIEGHSGE